MVEIFKIELNTFYITYSKAVELVAIPEMNFRRKLLEAKVNFTNFFIKMQLNP